MSSECYIDSFRVKTIDPKTKKEISIPMSELFESSFKQMEMILNSVKQFRLASRMFGKDCEDYICYVRDAKIDREKNTLRLYVYRGRFGDSADLVFENGKLKNKIGSHAVTEYFVINGNEYYKTENTDFGFCYRFLGCPYLPIDIYCDPPYGGTIHCGVTILSWYCLDYVKFRPRECQYGRYPPPVNSYKQICEFYNLTPHWFYSSYVHSLFAFLFFVFEEKMKHPHCDANVFPMITEYL